MKALSSPWVPSVSRLLLLAAWFCVSVSYSLAQAAGSDYTKDLPSVERVKAQLKGTDESDTLARQAAIFTYLVTYIDRIKSARSFRGPYTPGESTMRNAYSLAAYQIEQDYKKTHTPAEVSAWSLAEGKYEINNALDWIHQLSGAQSNAAYRGAESVYSASAKRAYDREMRENEEAKERAQAAQNGPGQNGMANDAGSVAVRRCLELGGSSLECLGKGMGVGFLDLAGMSDSPMFKGPSFTGLTLNGAFKSGNGIDAEFGDTAVGLGNCGKLIIGSLAYTMQRNGNQVLIHVKNAPLPFTFVLGADGKLQGPASAEIAGKVVIGFHKVWVPNPVRSGYFQSQQTTSHQELTPLEAGQYAGQSGLTQNGQTYDMATTTNSSTYVPGGGGGGHYENVPDYAPKTQACTIGTLMPGPPVAPDPGMLANVASFAGMLFGSPATSSSGGAGPDLLAPGIRMAGVYASSGGLRAEFAAPAVVLDCGQAHVRGKYSVERAGPRILIHIENPASPFTLLVQPDGTLAGPATVSVAGRLVSGMNGNDVAYTPHTETCNANTLAPGSPASGPAPAVAGPQGPSVSSPVQSAPAVAGSAPATLPPTAASARASFRVLLQSQFSGANPLAGQHVFVMRERLDEALRKIGLPLPAGATPVQAMRALAQACHGRDCTSIYRALAQRFVASTALDAQGKAALSATAATGSYFFFATAQSGAGALMWDLPMNLVAGDNTVTFTAANAQALGQ